MSILIPGMEMPIDCCDCPMSGDYRMCCSLMPGVPALYAEFTDAIKTNRRHKDCPLIHVPPHGRLGDMDELYAHLNEWYLTNRGGMYPTEAMYIRAMLVGIKDAPTIIPAEEGE